MFVVSSEPTICLAKTMVLCGQTRLDECSDVVVRTDDGDDDFDEQK